MRIIYLLAVHLLALTLSGQCNFEVINTKPTCDEDFMDIFDLPLEKAIVVIGVSQNRIGEDPIDCNNGFLFKKYNYCGTLLSEKIFNNWDSFKFNESNYSRLADITATDFSHSNYSIIHKGENSYFFGNIFDSLGYYRSIYFILNSNGVIIKQKIYSDNQIKGLITHLMIFDEKRLLAVSILDNVYYFHFLNEEGEILKSIQVDDLKGAGLYFGAVSSDKQICFTGFKDFTPIGDGTSLFVIKLDTFGQILWTFKETELIGSGRGIFITDSSQIICALRYDDFYGNDAVVLIEFNNQGKEISRKIVEIPNFKLRPYDVSLYKSPSNMYYLATNLNPTHNNSLVTAHSIISLNDKLEYKWHKYFYTKDHTSYGHRLIECSDNDLAFIGKIRRRSPNGFGSVILKTKNEAPVSIDQPDWKSSNMVVPNPAFDYISYFTSSDFNLNYVIYNLNGQSIQTGLVEERISIIELNSGLYFIHIKHGNELIDVLKFIKL